MCHQKYQCSNSPCWKGTNPRTTPGYKELPCYRSTETGKATLEKGFIIISSLTQNNHFRKKHLHMFSCNVSQASVFYRFRDSYSCGTEEETLDCTEGHSYMGKVIPIHVTRGDVENFCSCFVLWRTRTKRFWEAGRIRIWRWEWFTQKRLVCYQLIIKGCQHNSDFASRYNQRPTMTH